MNDSALNSRLSAAATLLKEIAQGEFAEHRPAMDSLMATVYELGTALRRDSRLAVTEPVVSFIRQAQSIRNRLLLMANLYVMNTTHILTSSFMGEEWFQVCYRRSAVEFLRTLLSVTPENDLVDTENLDEFIRERGDTEAVTPPGGIDTAIPFSHWWWWLPDQPPTGN